MAVIGYCEGCKRTTYVGELEERACPACGRSLTSTRLEPGRERLIGANQSRFRDLNEAEVEGETAPRLEISCECAAVDCDQPLDVLADAYSDVRSHPTRFFVAIGHQIPEAERVVDSTTGYLVVEKKGDARNEALAQADTGTS